MLYSSKVVGAKEMVAVESAADDVEAEALTEVGVR